MTRPTAGQSWKCHLVLAVIWLMGLSFTPLVLAQSYWTNTGSSANFTNPAVWSTGVVPNALSTVDFTNNTSYTIFFTSIITNQIANFGINSGNGGTVTLNITGNTWALTNSTTGYPFNIGQAANATATVYLAGGTLIVTNGVSAVAVGYPGVGTFYVTNGTVLAQNTDIGVNAGQGKMVLSGSGTVYTNYNGLNVGFTGATAHDSLVISNSALLDVLGVMSIGGSGTGGFDSFALTNATLLTGQSSGGYWVYVGNGSSSNTASVLAGGVWNNNGKALYLGQNAATGNVLTINGGIVTNIVMNVGTSSSGASLGNQLVITNNGQLWSSGAAIIGNGASSNTAVIAAGGMWNNSGSVTIGLNGGSGNGLITTNGGTLFASQINLGVGGYGVGGLTNNFLIASGRSPASLLINDTGVLNVGGAQYSPVVNNFNNVLTITNGTVTTPTLEISGLGNGVLVQAGGSLLTTSFSLEGSNNFFTVDGGGVTTNSLVQTTPSSGAGGGIGGGGNRLTVTNGGYLSVANANNNSTFSLYGASNSLVIIGSPDGSAISVMALTNTGWQNQWGGGIDNVIRIDKGGVLTNLTSFTWATGAGTTADQLIVTNGGKLFVGGMTFGDLGSVSNSIVVAGGGQWISSGAMTIQGTNNGVLLSGSNSLWNANSNPINFGYTYSTANASISNSFTVMNNAVLTNVGSILLGEQGGVSINAYNTLTVSNGAKLFSGSVTVGYQAGDASNAYYVGGYGAFSAVSNGTITIGNYSTGNRVIVTNATLLSNNGTIGNGGSNNLVLVQSGGLWNLQGNALTVGSGSATGNIAWIQSGGLLAANTLVTGNGAGNIITNSGGVYQFGTATPTITPGAGASSIAINSGAISFQGVNSGLNLTNNWNGSQLTSLAWSGTNALDLNNSTATNTVTGGYTFDTGRGATNYYQLALLNGTTAVTGNGITIGAAGSLIISNTTATFSSVVTNYGVSTSVGSVANFNGGLINTGWVTATSSGLQVSGMFTNTGTLNMISSVGTYHSAVINAGAWISDPSSNIFLSTLTVTSTGYVHAAAGDVYVFNGNLINQSTQSNNWNTLNVTPGSTTTVASTEFLFQGTGANSTQTFATVGLLLTNGFTTISNNEQVVSSYGAVSGFDNNFALGELAISNTTLVLAQTTPSSITNALFVNDLYLFAGAQLVISNNMDVYFVNSNGWDISQITLDSGAKIYQLSGSPIPLTVPEPSVLLMWLAGALTLWAAHRRANRTTA